MSLRRFLPRRVVWEPWGVVLSGILLWINSGGYLWLLLAAALLHEGGHLLCAGRLSCPVACLRLGLMGARLEMADAWMGYRKEVAVAVGGALANVLGALMAFIAVRWGGMGERTVFFMVANLVLAGVNLLPAEGLDGGVILYASAAEAFGPFVAHRLLRAGSWLGLTAAAAGGLWLWYRTGRNVSVLVLVWGLLFRLRGEKEKRPH